MGKSDSNKKEKNIKNSTRAKLTLRAYLTPTRYFMVKFCFTIQNLLIFNVYLNRVATFPGM